MGAGNRAFGLKFLLGFARCSDPSWLKSHFDPKPKGSSPDSDKSESVATTASTFLMPSAQNFFRYFCVPPFIFPGRQTLMKIFVAQVVGWLGHGTASGDWSLLGAPRDDFLVWWIAPFRDRSSKLLTELELHFPSSTFAASKSVATASHLCAKPSNLSRSASVRAVCANSKHRLAFSRHSFGSPGMMATLMFRYGHSHVHRRAARALKGQSSQLTHDRMPLSADQSRDSTALFAGGAIGQITGYDFNCKH